MRALRARIVVAIVVACAVACVIACNMSSYVVVVVQSRPSRRRVVALWRRRRREWIGLCAFCPDTFVLCPNRARNVAECGACAATMDAAMATQWRGILCPTSPRRRSRGCARTARAAIANVMETV
jgi:hypothetical protein